MTDLFAYGTLTPGAEHWPVVRPFVERYRAAAVPGVLYDTGRGYPTATFEQGAPGDPGGLVHGFVLGLAPARLAVALRRLDNFEGDEYERVAVRTTDSRDATAYRHRGPVEGLTRIATGRWRATADGSA